MCGGRADVVLKETLGRHLFAANSRDRTSLKLFSHIRAMIPFPPEIRHAGVRRGLHRYGRHPRLLNDYNIRQKHLDLRE